MISAYMLRLVCLSLASFFLVHAALSLLARIAQPRALQLAQRMAARSATQLLFALRMAPWALSVFAVAGFCIPSYLWLEPKSGTEEMGAWCLGAAILGAAVWMISVARVFRATFGSHRYALECRQIGHEAHVPGEASPALVIDEESPHLAVSGVLRPRLVISRSVLRVLSSDQLDAALCHERAHRTSRDNLKRFLLLLAPDIFPFTRGFAALERGWARYAEWAADDFAVEGDAGRSLSLAAALVRVARIGSAGRRSPLAASLLADGQDLSARVDRPLGSRRPAQSAPRGLRVLLATAGVMFTGLAFSALFHPATFYLVHELLEKFLH